MLSERLRSLRKSIGISQKGLADQLFISQQAVAKWENGLATPNPEMLAKISEIFNVSVDYLLGVSDIKKASPDEDADLTEEEQALLKLFRGASADLQDAVLRVLEADLRKEQPQPE